MEALQEFMKAIKTVGGASGPEGGSQDKVTQALLGMMTNMGKVSEAVSGGGGASPPPRPPPTMAGPPAGMPPIAQLPRPLMPPSGAGPTPPGTPPMPPGMMGPQGPGMPGAMQKIGTNPQAMAYLKSLVPGLGAGGGTMPGV